MGIFKNHIKGMMAIVMALAVTITSISFEGNTKIKGAGEFPATGVHTGTLSHGSYYGLVNLYSSTGASVIEADTMTCNGEKRACFCLSPGVSETTKAGAYKSANFTSGYGIKYYKALMQFYYDKKDDYKDNAIRFATGMWVWRTVILERNNKGNFQASDYNGNSFKSGFVSSMKSIFGYSDETANNIYNKAYDYIKDGANGKYNSAWALLKWTANASQTMLTGKKVPSPKSLKIKINKDMSLAGTSISLSGTEYILRSGSASGTKVGTFKLDKDGIDTISLSQKNDYNSKVKYYICESKNVAGTISNKNKKSIEFTIDWSKVSGDGGTVYMNKNGLITSRSWFSKGTDFNDRCKGQFIEEVASIIVDITKESEDGDKLAGAEFTIWAYNKSTGKYDTKVNTSNNLNKTITNPLITNNQGKAKSALIYYTAKNQGKFLVEETKAPDRFVNHREKKYIVIPSGNNVTTNETIKTFKFKDEEIPYTARLYVAKSDMDTNEPITDVEFEIQQLLDNKTGKPIKIADAIDYRWGNRVKLDQQKENGELSNTFKSGELVSGCTYQLIETKRPRGFWSVNISSLGGNAGELIKTLADCDKHSFNFAVNIEVVGDNKINVLDTRANRVQQTLENDEPLEVHNATAYGKVIIKKVDSKNSSKTLSGASFELWQISDENDITDNYMPSTENGDILAGEGITDDNGEVTFDYVKPEYHYILVETKQPEGYKMPVDNTTHIYVSADEVAANANGLGYFTDDNGEKVSPYYFVHESTISNEKAYIDLNIHKISTSRTGKESVALPGAKFALYKVDKIITDKSALSDDQLVQEDDNNNGIDNDTEEAIEDDIDITEDEADDGSLSNMNYIDYDFSKLTPVEDGIVTDESGNATVSQKLEAGGYVLVETEAPKNYKVADPQYIFVDTEQLYSAEPYSIEVKDEEFEAEVKVTKHDKLTGKVIKQAGVGFKIKDLATNEYIKQTVDTYAEPEVEGAPHDLIKSEETDTFYTDETGSVTLPNVLPVGKYQMEEAVAPNGYTLDLEPVPFEIDDEMAVKEIDENTREVVVPLNSNDLPTNVEITKAKLSDKSELEGAKLKVEDESGKTVDEWVSKKEPHTISGLSIGKTYTLIETKPADGYVTAEKISFTIKDTNDVQKVVMYDDVTKVKITKSDITTGEPVIGAKLEIIDKDGNTFDSWTTTKEEHYIEKIPVGTYTLKETYAPDAYVTNEITFKVKDTGLVQKVDMKDDFTKVRLLKTEKDSEKRLSNAVFSVTDSNGKVVIANLVTNSNGEININKKLRAGKTYTFTELKAPDGYKIAKPVKYKVKNTGDIQFVTVEDESIVKIPTNPHSSSSVSAPQTGGRILPMWCVIGIAASLVLMVLGIFGFRRKRKAVQK